MRRLIQVGFTLLAIFAVAAVLITPTTSDDVDGILHRHHPQVSPWVVRCQIHNLIDAFPPSRETVSTVYLLQDFNRLCIRLC